MFRGKKPKDNIVWLRELYEFQVSVYINKIVLEFRQTHLSVFLGQGPRGANSSVYVYVWKAKLWLLQPTEGQRDWGQDTESARKAHRLLF